MDLIKRALCADCFDYMAAMPNDSVYCTITDFPYGECTGYKEGGYTRVNRDGADTDADGTEFDYMKATREIIRVTKGSCLIFCGSEQVSTIKKIMRDSGLNMTRIVVWEKTNGHCMNCDKGFLSSLEVAVFGRKSKAYWGGKVEHACIVHPTMPNRWHPTAKPIPLLKKFVTFMCPEGETVFDPCAGSFSTAVAAAELGRGFVCIEKNPVFFDRAMEHHKDKLFQDLLL